MLEGVQKWDELTADEKKLFARMAEVYAGYMAHTDAQIGRVVDFLEETGQLDNTMLFVFIGDNGSSGEGTLNGVFNEQSITIFSGEPPETWNGTWRIDQFGQPGSYNHYPIGWALAGTRRSSCASSTRTSVGCGTAWSCTGPTGSPRRASSATSNTTSPTSCRRSSKRSASRPRGSSTPCSRSRSRATSMLYSFNATPDAPSTARHAVLRDARQPRPLLRRLEGRHLRRAQAVGERRRVGLRGRPLGALRPRGRPGRGPRPDGRPRPRQPRRSDGQEVPGAGDHVVGRSRQVPGVAARRPVPGARLDREALYSTRDKTTWYEGAVRVQPFEAPPR